MPDRMLEGQVALVTGAGRGLGRAFADRLAALGCHIGVHGMREQGPSEYGGSKTLTDVARIIAETHGVRTVKPLADLTRIDEIERCLATADGELGPIDILVHNAGGDIAAAGGKPDPNDAVHIKEEDVRAVLDRNLISTILVCQQVARGMMQRRRGRIVTIGSVAAFKGRTNGSIYATAKAGALHFTRCLADQMRPYDVTVNAIAPGIRAPSGSWPRAPSIRRGWPRPARSTASPPSTRWRASSSSSPGRWAPSCRGRWCASTAAARPGRRDGTHLAI